MSGDMSVKVKFTRKNTNMMKDSTNVEAAILKYNRAVVKDIGY